MKTIEFVEYIFEDTIEDFLVEETLEAVYTFKDKFPMSTHVTNIGGWQHHNLHDLDLFNPIKKKIFDCFDKSVNVIHDKYAKDLREEQSWGVSISNLFANVNGAGAYHPMHYHFGCDYTGVVYLKTPPKCGNIIMQSPFRSPWMSNFCVNTHQNYFKVYVPKAGSILIFPSYIMHHVDFNRNPDGEDRVSMSFNLKVTY